MNEHFDPLEAELAALKPQPPSPDLRQRLADKLDSGVEVVARPRSRRVWSSAAAIGGLVAACLTVALLPRPRPSGNSEPDSPVATRELPVAVVFDEALPTFWTYQRAFSRSPQDLDALLDKHAVLAPAIFSRTPAHVFIHADAERLLQGEL